MMITNKFRVDGVAISLSLLCALHCLFVPSFIILAPSFLSISFNNEFIHYLILLLAVPISVFALSIGYKAHKNLSMVVIGFWVYQFFCLPFFMVTFYLEKLEKKD